MASFTTTDGVRIYFEELLSPAGHFANRDQPEAFDRAVLDFLAPLGT